MAPPGSVSWKYIDESVAKGELLDINDYIIHQANVSRPVGSSAPTKNTRTPFTPLDIQIIVTWVRQKEQSGQALKGPTVWQELAELVSSPPLAKPAPLCTPFLTFLSVSSPYLAVVAREMGQGCVLTS